MSTDYLENIRPNGRFVTDISYLSRRNRRRFRDSPSAALTDNIVS
jgi:hypothetical protein